MGFFRKTGMIVAVVTAAFGMAGCGKADLRNEVVATANGEQIKVQEVRESLDIPGGLIAASGESLERKKDVTGRLVALRLLAAEARARGLDNTDEFRDAVKKNEQLVFVTAYFRKEVSNLKIAKGDIQAEVKKLRNADKNLSEKDAEGRAGRIVTTERIRKLENDVVAVAKKDTPANIDREMIRKVASGEKVPDDAVLATTGSDKISLGRAKALLASISGAGGAHGAQDFLKNPTALEQVIDREATLAALAAYAKKQGIGGTEILKAVRQDMERSVLVGLIVDKGFGKDLDVTDKEIEAAYADHADRLVQDGKKVPLAAVKDQIRGFIQKEKKKKALDAYIEELKKKAKITINDSVLSKV